MFPGMNQMIPGMPKPRPIPEYETTYLEEVIRFLGAIPVSIITSILDIPIETAMAIIVFLYIISAVIIFAFKISKEFNISHEVGCLCKYPIAAFLSYVVVYNIKLLL